MIAVRCGAPCFPHQGGGAALRSQVPNSVTVYPFCHHRYGYSSPFPCPYLFSFLDSSSIHIGHLSTSFCHPPPSPQTQAAVDFTSKKVVEVKKAVKKDINKLQAEVLAG